MPVRDSARIKHGLGVCLLVVLACTSCESNSAVAPTTPLPPSGGSPTVHWLTGTITEPAGLPIPGVAVSVGDVTVVTDAKGHYEVANPVKGHAPIRVKKDGFRFGTWDDSDRVVEVDDTLTGEIYPGQNWNFIGARVPRLAESDRVVERLDMKEPPKQVWFLEGSGGEDCTPCQVFLVDVTRPGHLFVTVTWNEDVDLALWVTGQSGPKVARRLLVRDTPVDRAGTVECLLGGSSAGGWTPVRQAINLEITTVVVPD